MSERSLQNPEYLRGVAYRDASRLDARVALWERYSSNQGALSEGLFTYVAVPGDASVLEVGSGPGNLWSQAFEHGLVPPGWAVTITDLSEGMLDEARRRLSDQDRNLSFQVADVCDLGFADGEFDIVVAKHMLYHATDLDAALSEIRRVLKPRGSLYATTNSNRHISEIVELRNRFASPAAAAGVGPAHDRFTLDDAPDALWDYFSTVDSHLDEETLQVDDAELIVGYILSMSIEVDEDALHKHVASVIRDKGFFAITRSSGTIIARK